MCFQHTFSIEAGSMVPPLLLATRNSACSGSRRASAPAMAASSVVSMTTICGKPSRTPYTLRITSAQRLLPPMPSRYTVAIRSRRISSARAPTRSSSGFIPVGTSSHPSRLAMDSAAPPAGSAVQAETSRRQMRPMRRLPTAAVYNYWRSTTQMINVTPAAAGKINELLQEENKTNAGLRVFVQGGGCSGFQYGLMIDEGEGDAATDAIIESNGVKLLVDPISARYLRGAEVDFVDNVTGGGFTIKNPNAKSTCGCGSSFSV